MYTEGLKTNTFVTRQGILVKGFNGVFSGDVKNPNKLTKALANPRSIRLY